MHLVFLSNVSMIASRYSSVPNLLWESFFRDDYARSTGGKDCASLDLPPSRKTMHEVSFGMHMGSGQYKSIKRGDKFKRGWGGGGLRTKRSQVGR